MTLAEYLSGTILSKDGHHVRVYSISGMGNPLEYYGSCSCGWAISYDNAPPEMLAPLYREFYDRWGAAVYGEVSGNRFSVDPGLEVGSRVLHHLAYPVAQKLREAKVEAELAYETFITAIEGEVKLGKYPSRTSSKATKLFNELCKAGEMVEVWQEALTLRHTEADRPIEVPQAAQEEYAKLLLKTLGGTK